jgi:soluble lytic murein transglycosylase-like protein
MPPGRNAIASALLALVLVTAAAVVRAGTDGVYMYTDPDGSVHLTNVPDDRRYSVLIPGTLTARAQSVDAAGAGGDPSAARTTFATSHVSASVAVDALLRAGAPDPFKAMVAQASKHAGIDRALLHAVIAVESGYNPRAVSKKGAAGLMQLMPDTAKRYKVVNVFDPQQNVRGGAQYLADLLKMFGNDLRLALAAYNAGEAAVIKYGGHIPPFPETVAYVPKVIDYYGRLRLSM